MVITAGISRIHFFLKICSIPRGGSCRKAKAGKAVKAKKLETYYISFSFSRIIAGIPNQGGLREKAGKAGKANRKQTY